MVICNFKSHGLGGHNEKVIFEQGPGGGERWRCVPIWWKGFPRKGLEEQLSKQGDGNRRSGLRSERLWGYPVQDLICR